MSRTSKILIGIMSMLPIILTGTMFIFMFLQFSNMAHWEDKERPSTFFFGNFQYFFMLMMVMFLLSIGLLVFFIIQLVKNKKMDPTERAIWILAFVLGGMLSYPIYWYMKIWKEDL